MILYHFTAHARLEAILREGLNRGEAPISDRQALNAVNLTTSSDPFGHGLDNSGKVLSDDDCARLFLATGQRVAPGTVYANKRAVRIAVKIPSSDRALKQWLPWARKHVEPEFLARLHRAAGSEPKFKTWWLYFGTVPPSAFVAVDILEPESEAA